MLLAMFKEELSTNPDINNKDLITTIEKVQVDKIDEVTSGNYKQELSAIIAAASLAVTPQSSNFTDLPTLNLDLPAAVKERPERMLKTYLQAGQAGGFKERKRTAYIVGNTGIYIKG